PVGLINTWKATQWFEIGMNFTWMPQAYTALRITPVGGANWIIKLRVDNFQIDLPMNFRPMETDSFWIGLKPFFIYWHDGETIATDQIGDPLGIPKNTYYYGGLELNATLRF